MGSKYLVHRYLYLITYTDYKKGYKIWIIFGLQNCYKDMEDQFNAPEQEEQPVTVETTSTPNEPTGEDKGTQQTPITEKQQNNFNAQRRIRQRNARNKRIAELEAELAKYKDKDDDFSKFQTTSLNDRIGDMRATMADEDVEDFRSHAESLLGDETEKFMQDTYRYADYVNKNEPDVLLYAQREYGPILLAEWYKRMDDPRLNDQWKRMTAYEKGMVLSKLYEHITNVIATYNKNNGKPSHEVNKGQSVPIPGSGRQTQTNEPTDDFSIEFARAEARHKRGK